jgi:hypothetical protein
MVLPQLENTLTHPNAFYIAPFTNFQRLLCSLARLRSRDLCQASLGMLVCALKAKEFKNIYLTPDMHDIPKIYMTTHYLFTIVHLLRELVSTLYHMA